MSCTALTVLCNIIVFLSADSADDIVCAGEELQIVFDNVDPQDHKRQFAFAVKIQEGKKYAGMQA